MLSKEQIEQKRRAVQVMKVESSLKLKAEIDKLKKMSDEDDEFTLQTFDGYVEARGMDNFLNGCLLTYQIVLGEVEIPQNIEESVDEQT